MTIPQSHIDEAHKLDADAYVDCFEFVFKRFVGTLRVHPGPTSKVWSGRTWQPLGIKMDGDKRSSGDDISRPTLTIINPEGVYSTLADQGYFDRATVRRYRVLRTHWDAGTDISQKRSWFISRPSEISRIMINFEMRSVFDSQFWVLPPRMFIPPEFKAVSLS